MRASNRSRPRYAAGAFSFIFALERHHADLRQLVALADRVVVEVVRRRDLHAAGAELRIDVVVGDDRDLPPGERQSHALADELGVALVLRIHRDGDVAEHGFRPRGRDHDAARPVLERIADLPDLAVLLLAVDLEVGHRGAQHRVPVDQALAAVDETLLVQPDEYFARPRATCARPW